MVLLVSDELPSFLSSDWVSKMPFVGTIARCLQCVFVDRSNEESRSKVTEQLIQRQKEISQGAGWPKLAIFPEGTTTNGHYLLFFKPGAFLGRVPVQPMVMDYSANYYFETGMECIPIVTHVFFLTCQLSNSLTLRRMPVVNPLPDEDVKAFAQRTRDAISEYSGLPQDASRMEDKLEFLGNAYKMKLKKL